MTADFVPGRAAFAAVFGADTNLVFFNGLDDAGFFVDFGMVVSGVRESTIGSPTTQSPRFAGCYHSSGWLWPGRISPAQPQCVLCERSPVTNRKFHQQAKISSLQAHNLKAVSSNLAPAIKSLHTYQWLKSTPRTACPRCSIFNSPTTRQNGCSSDRACWPPTRRTRRQEVVRCGMQTNGRIPYPFEKSNQTFAQLGRTPYSALPDCEHVPAKSANAFTTCDISVVIVRNLQ